MNTALAPHPRLNLAAPIVSLRELMLAAQGLQHKATSEARAQTIRVLSVQLCAAEELTRQLGTLTAAQSAQITDLQERNAALKQRNAELTTALHRQACAGHAIPEVLGFIVSVAAVLVIAHGWGGPGLVSFALGFFLGLAWMILAIIRAKPARTTARHRQHPAHIDEPMSDAEIMDAIRRRDVPLGEAYEGEGWDVESHPEALTRQLNEAIHHPATEAARERFERTAQALQTA